MKRGLLFPALVLALLLVGVESASASTNYLTNGGFEAGNLSSWSIGSHTFYSPTYKHFGSYGANFDYPNATGAYLSQSITWGGGDLNASVWVMYGRNSSEGSGPVNPTFRIVDPNSVNHDITLTSAGGGVWFQSSQTFTSASPGTWTIKTISNGNSTYAWFFDDFFLGSPLDPTATPTNTLTPTTTPTPTQTATATPFPTNTPLPTVTPIPTNTPVPTLTPFPTITPTPTSTPTPVPSSTPTPFPTITPTAVSTSTAVPSASPMPSSTLTRTATPSGTKVLGGPVDISKLPLTEKPIGDMVGLLVALPWVLGGLGLVLALYLGGEFMTMARASMSAIFGEAAFDRKEFRVEDEESGEAEWMSQRGLADNLTKAGYKDMGVKKGKTHRHVMLDENGIEVEGTAKDVEHYVPEDWNS